MSDLTRRSYQGAFWSAIDAFAGRLLRFVIGIILARLLLPEQFGLIGMLAIFMAISQGLLQSGFGSALIQKENATDIDTSSVFYFNVVISIMLAGLLTLAAPWIAFFYSQPILSSLTRALSVVVIIDAFGVVQTAMLTRRLEFKTQTKVNFVAGACSGAIGISMAYSGFGVWSLVAQQISAAAFRVALLWAFNDWRPRLAFSVSSLRTMFGFGSPLLVASLLGQFLENVYYAVIGRLFSPAALGFYTRARQMEELPSRMLSKTVTRVALPAFSSVQSQHVRLKRALRKALRVVVLFNAPVMIGLAVVGEPLVLVLLTEKWLPSVPYFQLLCLVGLVLPLQRLNLNIFKAKGRSDLYLAMALIKAALSAIAIATFYRWGITALIGGQLAVSALSYLITSYHTRKLVCYGPMQQLKDVGIYFVLGAVMGVGVYVVGSLPLPNDLLLLILQVGVGIVLYVMLCAVFRPPAFLEVFDALWKKLTNPPGTRGPVSRILLAGRSRTL